MELQRWNIFTLFLDVANAPTSKVVWLPEVNFWWQSWCVCVFITLLTWDFNLYTNTWKYTGDQGGAFWRPIGFTHFSPVQNDLAKRSPVRVSELQNTFIHKPMLNCTKCL